MRGFALNKSAHSKTRKKSFQDQPSEERRLLFSFDPYKNIWHYRTKTGVWRNIHDINVWGLRYILEKLEMEDRTSSEIYQVVKRELESRPEAPSA